MHCRSLIPVFAVAALTLLFSVTDAEALVLQFGEADCCAECVPAAADDAPLDACCGEDESPCPLPCQFCGCPLRAVPSMAQSAGVASLTAIASTVPTAVPPLLLADLDIDPRPPRFA
ncbi:MAG: hypothetical protein IPP94_10360 [Ignavibacteria bacterium]|nr:hypothetical protein [Ignavibacteria bacterium]